MALVLVAILLLPSCAGPSAELRLRIMVPNSPGSGFDVTARTASKLAETSGVTDGVEVFNLSGGGGVLALSRLMHETGNADLVMMMGLGVIGATVTHRSGATVTKATPIARLIEEPEGIMVPADSPYRTIGALLDAWRADPGEVAVGGGSSIGGPDHLMAARLGEAVGIDAGSIKYRSHDGGGELLPAVLDHEIDFAISGVREYTEQVKSGQLRVLAVSSSARLAIVDAPTLTEAGIAVVFANWRGVIAPPGITTAQRTALIDIFSRLERTEEWRAELSKNGWTDALLTGDAFASFLAQQNKEVAASLRELGAA